MISEKIRVKKFLFDNKQNKEKQWQTIMVYEQATPSFECSTFERSSKKSKIKKRQNRQHLAEKLINNFCIIETAEQSKPGHLMKSKVVVDDFGYDQSIDEPFNDITGDKEFSLSVTSSSQKDQPIDPGLKPERSDEGEFYFMEQANNKAFRIKKRQRTFQLKHDPDLTAVVFEDSSTKRSSEEGSPFNQIQKFKRKISTIRGSFNDIINNPVAKENIVRCLLRRVDVNHQKIYHFFNSQRELLMSAKKIESLATTFVLSSNPNNFSKGSCDYIGKVKSNLFENYFVVVVSHKNLGFQSKSMTATVQDKSRFLNGGRKGFNVYIPKMNQNGRQEIISEKEIGLHDQKYQDRVSCFVNKQMDENSIYETMSYKGRATVRSVKNFILKTQETNEQHLLFGKISKQDFNLDIRYPFSFVQAFCIALTRF